MGDGSPRLPGAVLFACDHNRVRSPMAAALLRLAFGNAVWVDSCGVRAPKADEYWRAPAEVDPFVAAVMDELGVDLSTHRPKSFADLDDGSFDLVVSLSAPAQHKAVELARNAAVELEYWPTLDPTTETGSRDQRLDAYRAVRDGLRARIRERFGRQSTFGG